MRTRSSRLSPSARAGATVFGSVLGSGLALGLGCSLALDLDEKVPCEADGDCVYSDGPGQCVAGFCAPSDDGGDDGGSGGPTTTLPGTGTDTGDPTGDADGSDTGSGSTLGLDDTSTAGDTTSGECSLNSECNEDQRCSAGTCVDLLSPECQILRYPAGVDRDKVVYLGSIMPTGGIFENLVTPLQNATQLAIDDFNDVTTLQGGREIAWVGCDDTDGADQAVAAATHLVQDVGVPAIVGPIFSESVLAIAEQVTVDAGVFVISPTASAQSLTNIDDDNLVWRVTPSDVYQVNGILDRMIELDPARLLVLYKDDAYGHGLNLGLQTELVQALPGTPIHFAEYENPAVFEGDQQALLASYGLVMGEAFSQPGVVETSGEYDSPDDHYTDVLILGTSEMQALVSAYLTIWSGSYTFAPMPRFTVSHGGVPQMELTVEQIAAAPGGAVVGPLIFANLEGITPNVFDPDNFTAFNIRYKIAFMNQDALTSSSLSYDATLAALFAAVTIPGSEPVTGTAIAQGMASLNDPTGTFVTFGGAGLQFIQNARNALASGNTVDLQGVSGALDWDPRTGELRANLLGWGLAGTPDVATLDSQRIYVLNPAPATDGTWMDLP